MSFGFNYFFKPFDVYIPEHKMDFFFISLLHAMVTIMVLFFMSLMLKPFPRYVENWKVLNEIIFLSSFLILLGVGQFLIRDIIYDNPNNWSWPYLFEEIRNTFLVGILFIALLVPLNFNMLYHRHQIKASTLPQKKPVTENAKIHIKTEVKADDFNLNLSSFVYAKADRNYVEIYLITDSGIVKKLKRISIKDLDFQLNHFQNIMRTHRSFMVNLNHLININGNAQGYKLSLRNSENTIPVSRSFITKLEERLKT